MDIPIDVSKMTFVVASPCKPRIDFQTGEQRTDKASGRGIWDVTVLMGNGAEFFPVKIKLLEPVEIAQMTPVTPVGLRQTKLTMRDGATVEYYTVDKIEPAVDGNGWGAVPAGKTAAQSAPAGQAGGHQAGAGKGGAA